MVLAKETRFTKIQSIQPPIHVIDSIMGSGKTSWAIQYMNEASTDKNFLYITPFLDEVERVRDNVNTRNFITPQTKNGKGKLNSLKDLILNERDIASTHALFENVNDEIIELLLAGNYTLILDEAMNVVDQLNLKKDSLRQMMDDEMIYVNEETGAVQWNEEGKYQDTEYNYVKNLARSENLCYFEDTILYWTFPVSVFQAFQEVYIMTYLFDAQQQKYYYDMYEIAYSYKSIMKLDKKYVLVNFEDREPYDKQHLKALINIYEGKLNNIGDANFSLSGRWFRTKGKPLLIEKLKKNVYTYFRRHAKTASILNMWTSYKEERVKLQGSGYKGIKHEKGKPHKKKECFVNCNARATNEFRHKESLAYLINRFMNPYDKKFFKSKGVEVDEDMFALAELLQWIWRSRIREGQPINLYIPSKRMRNLLINYLNNNM